MDRETNTPDNWDVPSFETLIYIMEHFPHIIIDVQKPVTLDPAGSSVPTKALLIIQVGWFCTNCASRLYQHLSLSLLEVSTAAHAFCTLVTYLVWWSKPTNVAAPTILRGNEAEEVYALLKCSDSEYDHALEMACIERTRGSGRLQETPPPARIVQAAYALRRLQTPQRPPHGPRFRNTDNSMLDPRNISSLSPRGAFLVQIATVTSPIIYGSIHFLAWSGNFPTPLERLLWRVSSIVVTGSGLVAVSLLTLLMMLNALLGYRARFYVVTNTMSVAVIYAIYLLASGFLLAESFRQLFFLDSTAYEVPSWTNYWPHIS